MSRYSLSKYASRLMAVLLACLLLVGCLPSALAAQSGSCGDQLSWSFSDGTLTVTGSGDMWDFSEGSMAPWYEFRQEILRLELPDGLTSIGTLAFYECESLTAVSIPDSVKRIGGYAFSGCADMEMLSLGNGVSHIGECAFSDCVSLVSLRLPQSLQTIGKKAFYRCETVPAVTVPESVRSIGVSAFAYCKNLVTADIRAQVNAVPEYIFYGCEKLTSVTLPAQVSQISEFAFRGCDNLGAVYYGGTAMSQEELRQQLNDSVTDFTDNGYVGVSSSSQSVTSSTKRENEDGSVTQENVTVTQSENATVSSNVVNTHPAGTSGGSFSAQIQVTVDSDSGWEDAKTDVEEALKDINDRVTNTGGTIGKVDITVYVKGEETVDQSFADSLASRDVTVTVVTQTGSTWKFDCSAVDKQELPETYDLRYSLSVASEEICQQMNVKKAYLLRFASDAKINAELMILLAKDMARKNATLFQQDDRDGLVQHQTVKVDAEGYAHFYLGSVAGGTDYYIAIDIPGSEEKAIIPDSLRGEYKVEYAPPVEYVITGRTSSWGMEIGQVTWILAAVMLGTVVVVGGVMFSLNKRRLKQGYIPDVSEE